MDLGRSTAVWIAPSTLRVSVPKGRVSNSTSMLCLPGGRGGMAQTTSIVLRRGNSIGLSLIAAAGMGVLLVSNEMEEILGVAHRVVVMRAGSVVADLGGADVTEAAILGAMFGTASAA